MSARLIELDTAKQTILPDEAQEWQRQGTRQIFVARVCFLVSAYAISAILARKLGPAEYGVYGVVVSLLAWLELFVNAGMPGATSKLIANGRHDPAEVERSARFLLMSLSVLLVAACWIFAPYVATFMRIPNGEVLFRIAVLDLPFAAFYVSYDGVLNAHRRFGALAFRQVLFAVTKLAGVVVLTGLGVSVERVFIANVVSMLAICGVLAMRFRPSGFRGRRRIMAEAASIAGPMGMYLLAGQVLLNLDLWSLNKMWRGGNEVVGQYVASGNLARTLSVIPAVQAGVLFASVAWAISARDRVGVRRHIQTATRFALILAAGAWITLGIDGSDILSVLFSDAYAAGHRFLSFQFAALASYAFLDVFAHALMAAGRQVAVAITLVGMLPFVWFSNYQLIPWLGPIGAAASLFLGTAGAAALLGVMAYRQFGSLFRLSTVLRVFIASVVVGFGSVVVPVHGPFILLKTVVFGTLYLLVLYVLGEVTGRDFGMMKSGNADPAQT